MTFPKRYPFISALRILVSFGVPHSTHQSNVVAYDGMGQRIVKIENTFNTEYERVYQPEIDEEEGSDIQPQLIVNDQQNEQQITSINTNEQIDSHNASFWHIAPQATLWNQIRDESIRCMKAGIVCRALRWGRNIFGKSSYVQNIQYVEVQLLGERNKISRDNSNWISVKEHQQNIWNDLQQPLWVNHCRRKAMERIEDEIYQITMHYYPQQQVLLVLIITLAEHQNVGS
ncbi:MAG: hypothetical protein EZS28_017975 [Streblomastix strix]|uniref:Uncharacterized protein n=1 Tax=Streblomastix strix TaxID=222440 RepID=A0A5J4VVL5_9EUKA|nr:MAG: hypothetical protein EZS28_017975 [Streblomastix strix]